MGGQHPWIIMAVRDNIPERFGFSLDRGGAHQARTMMLEELRLLLSHVAENDAPRQQYLSAVGDDNCLGKRSGRTRGLAFRHLSRLHGLDPTITTFRSLRYFWDRDPAGQPLIACLSAYARDSVFRMTAPFILSMAQGQELIRTDLEAFIDDREPGRLSPATLKSVAQNTASSWTQAGHIRGVRKKTRSSALATPGSTAYALFLGYLTGSRGTSLFSSEYALILDCPREAAIELAQTASQRGWIRMKRIGNVVEVLFPNLLTAEEKGWLRE